MSLASNAVDVDGIGKSFGSVDALRDISFEVACGEVVALLGPDGAGKTTTVDILSTLTKPERGRARVAGYVVVADPAMVRRSIVITGRNVALDDVLTGYENIVMFGRLQGLNKFAATVRAWELIRELDLEDVADRRVGTYSGGMRRRVDIACGVVVLSLVILLDEPTTGLDVTSRRAIWKLVTNFKHAGIATLFTTRYMEEAEALGDRIVVIDHGTIIAQGSAATVKLRIDETDCEVVQSILNSRVEFTPESDA